MSDIIMFTEAKEAIGEEDYDRARDLLTRLLRSDRNNPEYWLWMSTAVFSIKEKIFCLKNVIKLDPDNTDARRGLIQLGGIPSDGVAPSPIVERDWKVNIEQDELTGWKRRMVNPVIQIGVFLFVGVIVFGLIWAGYWGVRSIGKPRLTITPIPWTYTPTFTSTSTPEKLSHTLVFTPTPQPLWMLLDATYTPTPIYVNTQHPRVESYRLAIRAYGRGDYEEMVFFLEQTRQDEPEAVDVLYYLGEAYNNLGDYEKAHQYYEDAIILNPHFAPVYLSRAKMRQTLNYRVDILYDLNTAIESDPTYGEAYYERAIYWVKQDEIKKALADLEIAIDLMPYDPRIYLELAKTNLAIGENEMALENVLEAYRMDITLLETYLVLGKAYLANNMPEDALSILKIYGLYKPDDPLYLALLGGALYEIGEDYESALTILDRAKALDRDLVDIFYYHGLVVSKLGDSNQAVNDLYIAQNLKPGNLEYSLWFGIMLYEDGRFPEAYNQLGFINPINLHMKQAGHYYYYKAKSGMALSLIEPVKTAWQALLDLPRDSIPNAWINEAKEYLYPLEDISTPTQIITITNTSMITPKASYTPSITVNTSPTPSP